MVSAVPAPRPRELLPPLLACLPTAFVSARPPSALLPLLSPILRQRLQYSSDATGEDGWLSLLSWDHQRASKLAGRVEGMQLEPHPVSGELEIEDAKSVEYRRLDAETFQSRLQVEEHGLLPIYVWCETDTQEGSAGWKLAELRVLEDLEDGTYWYGSISEANEAVARTATSRTQTTNDASTSRTPAAADDDDDYWASYDRTPARTPAVRSPAPSSTHVLAQQTRDSPKPRTDDEDEYYARYGSVQPALDSHDPDEAAAIAEADHSTLHGESLRMTDRRPAPIPPSTHAMTNTSDDDRPTQRSLYPSDPKPHDSAVLSSLYHHHHHNNNHNRHQHHQQHHHHTIAPRPISPATSSSEASSKRSSVEKLERRVQLAADMTRAETGVRSFIGSEVRNLFRLARSVGMDEGEFAELVGREVELCGLLGDA